VADARGREREQHLISRRILTDPADDLDGGARGGRSPGEVGAQPTCPDLLPDGLRDGTSDDDDHLVSLAVLQGVTGTSFESWNSSVRIVRSPISGDPCSPRLPGTHTRVQLSSRRPRTARRSGQSTVEFALVAPILLVLLVAIADFGRVFASGVVVEAAARNAAEVVAEEYIRNPPGDTVLPAAQRLAVPAPNPGTPSYYDDLATKAARSVCVEMRNLPNASYDATTGACPDWPVIRVCVHDQTANSANNHCGQPITPGFNASPPAECTSLPPPGDPTWDPSMSGGGMGSGGEPSRYVEVRVCYLFTTLLNVPVVPNSVLFQVTRIFTIACFQDPSAAGNNGSC
jgi:hypothetical protein